MKGLRVFCGHFEKEGRCFMKKYRVYAVYVGCNYGEVVVDTYEEALQEQQAFIDMVIEDFGEWNYLTGNGDFSVTIEEIEV